MDPDDIFKRWVERLLPLWGPFYALYYIIRYLIHELSKRKHDN